MSKNFKFVINIQEATAHLITGQTKVCLEIMDVFAYMHFHNVWMFMSVPSPDEYTTHCTSKCCKYIYMCIHLGWASSFIQHIRAGAHTNISHFTLHFCFLFIYYFAFAYFHYQTNMRWKYGWVIVDLLIIFCHALNMNENISVSAVSLCLYRAWIMAVC